jgi:putative endonuclease
MERQYFVYIMTNTHHTVLYTGVTNDLARRVDEHRRKLVKGFTNRYNVNKLVYYEVCGHIEAAILREKQIKAGSRARKLALINRLNPLWESLNVDS